MSLYDPNADYDVTYMGSDGQEPEPKEVLWEGHAGDALYRVAGYDDSYGGLAWAVECWEEGGWLPISHAPSADAPEVAAVAAQIAKELKEVRDGE